MAALSSADTAAANRLAVVLLNASNLLHLQLLCPECRVHAAPASLSTIIATAEHLRKLLRVT